jgi:hypothetical protein
MQLKKLRDSLVEAKLYYNRTASYLSIFNFLMIALIFLNTTVWSYGFIQKIFPNHNIFLLSGIAGVLIVMTVIGYMDTKLKIWRTESERGLTADRNPQLVVEAFQCAKMLNDLKNKGKDTKEVEEHLDSLFARCGLNKEFDHFKNNTK